MRTGSGAAAVELERVSKTFRRGRRRVRALDAVSVTVERGRVAALVGRNGAGKTTALRVLATLVLPSSGSARVCGYDVVTDGARVRRLLGVSLGSGRSFYWRLSALHNLEFFARLKGLGASRSRSDILRTAAELDLEQCLSRPVRTLSRGVLARLSAARAFLGDPAVLLLDEPFASVDERARELLWDALERRARSGLAVVLATHDRSVAARCDVTVELGAKRAAR